jgi:hypothetical protein
LPLEGAECAQLATLCSLRHCTILANAKNGARRLDLELRGLAIGLSSLLFLIPLSLPPSLPPSLPFLTFIISNERRSCWPVHGETHLNPWTWSDGLHSGGGVAVHDTPDPPSDQAPSSLRFLPPPSCLLPPPPPSSLLARNLPLLSERCRTHEHLIKRTPVFRIIHDSKFPGNFNNGVSQGNKHVVEIWSKSTGLLHRTTEPH